MFYDATVTTIFGYEAKVILTDANGDSFEVISPLREGKGFIYISTSDVLAAIDAREKAGKPLYRDVEVTNV